MKTLKMISMLLFLFCSPLVAEVSSKEVTQEFRWQMCKETSLYYSQFGNKRNWNEYRQFMYSAARVAKMFPIYPAKDEQDRTLQFFEFGGVESMWTQDTVVVNVPGAKYSNGQVKRVSVDVSWVGLNEDSIEWTYRVAKAIQNKKPIPKHCKINDWYANKEFIELMKNVYIPKGIKLKKIDKNVITLAKEEYKILKKKIRNPNILRETLAGTDFGYSESTQDELDSVLIYRVIEELDRKSRGWKYGGSLYSNKRRSLYKHLSENVINE